MSPKRELTFHSRSNMCRLEWSLLPLTHNIATQWKQRRVFATLPTTLRPNRHIGQKDSFGQTPAIGERFRPIGESGRVDFGGRFIIQD